MIYFSFRYRFGKMNVWLLIMALPIFWRRNILCNGQKCLNVMAPHFEKCANDEPEVNALSGAGECSTVDVCQKKFHFTKIRMEPFDSIIYNIFSNIFSICCGKCKRIADYSNTTIEVKDFNQSSINKSDFIFPVFGFHDSQRVHGCHFIPILDLSGGYYVTQSRTQAEIMTRLITSCANTWPLLVIIILLSAIAGFFIWVLETWFNKEEFPRVFHVGLFDGFWWSFISMTTVGYGDKSPKFVVSRLFSVIWILIGITISSMFTAALTNEITSASAPTNPHMQGQTVAGLKFRTFDASVIAKHGGILQETKGVSTKDDLVELKKWIRDKNSKVNGFFLDKYTFMYASRFANSIHSSSDNAHPNMEHAQYFLEETIVTKKIFDGSKMSYGILVKNEDDYKYFNEFAKDNQAIFATCTTIGLNFFSKKIKNRSHDIFSPKGGHFFPALIACSAVIGCILIFGAVFEFCRKKRVQPSDPSTS